MKDLASTGMYGAANQLGQKPTSLVADFHKTMDELDEVYGQLITLRTQLLGPFPEGPAEATPSIAGSVNEMEERLACQRSKLGAMKGIIDQITARIWG